MEKARLGFGEKERECDLGEKLRCFCERERTAEGGRGFRRRDIVLRWWVVVEWLEMLIRVL